MCKYETFYIVLIFFKKLTIKKKYLDYPALLFSWDMLMQPENFEQGLWRGGEPEL